MGVVTHRSYTSLRGLLPALWVTFTKVFTSYLLFTGGLWLSEREGQGCSGMNCLFDMEGKGCLLVVHLLQASCAQRGAGDGPLNRHLGRRTLDLGGRDTWRLVGWKGLVGACGAAGEAACRDPAAPASSPGVARAAALAIKLCFRLGQWPYCSQLAAGLARVAEGFVCDSPAVQCTGVGRMLPTSGGARSISHRVPLGLLPWAKPRSSQVLAKAGM